jgi:hypothetical protein
MPHHRALKFAFAVPNIVLAVLVAHHVIDAMMHGEGDGAASADGKPWAVFTEHPWFLFTAVVAVLLAVFHVLAYSVALLGARARDVWGLRWLYKLLYKIVAGQLVARVRVDLFLLVLDGAWSVLWVLQLFVQVLLPREHRVYALATVYTMMALHFAQALLAAPLVARLYEDYRELIAGVVHVATAKPAPSGRRLRTLVAFGHGDPVRVPFPGRDSPPGRGDPRRR